MLCDAARDNAFGIETYQNGITGIDYLEIMREFTRRLNVRLDGLELGRVYRGGSLDDYTLAASDCVPGGMDTDLKGKIVVIKPERLSPEYRSLSFQLALATSGFGCEPDARGRAVCCTELYSGEQARWNRSDILGVASEGILPAWAKLKLAALTEQRTLMDKDLFWQIIDEARGKAGRWQDIDAPLATTLSALESADIIKWQQIFDEYQSLSRREGLWAAAAVTLGGGCSDDSFDYFRGWLTAQGKDVFLNALADPDSLADSKAVQAFGCEYISLEFTPDDGYKNEPRSEAMLSVAARAFERKGDGYDIYDKIGDSPLSEKEKAAIAGEINCAADIDVKWQWHTSRSDFGKGLRERFPRLCKLFDEDAAADLAKPEYAPPTHKESVMKQIREAKAAPKQPHKPKSPGKSHGEEL
jgi:hypothetical protein